MTDERTYRTRWPQLLTLMKCVPLQDWAKWFKHGKLSFSFPLSLLAEPRNNPLPSHSARQNISTRHIKIIFLFLTGCRSFNSVWRKREGKKKIWSKNPDMPLAGKTSESEGNFLFHEEKKRDKLSCRAIEFSLVAPDDLEQKYPRTSGTKIEQKKHSMRAPATQWSEGLDGLGKRKRTVH